MRCLLRKTPCYRLLQLLSGLQIKFIVKWTLDFKPKWLLQCICINPIFWVPYVSRQDVKALLIDLPFILRPYPRALPGCASWVANTTVAITAARRNATHSANQMVLLTLTAFKVLEFGCWKLRKLRMIMHDFYNFITLWPASLRKIVDMTLYLKILGTTDVGKRDVIRAEVEKRRGRMKLCINVCYIARWLGWCSRIRDSNQCCHHERWSRNN